MYISIASDSDWVINTLRRAKKWINIIQITKTMKNLQCSGSVRTILKCVQHWTSLLWRFVKICPGNSLPPTFLQHVIYVFIRELSILVTYFLTWNGLLPWEGIHIVLKILISVLRTSYWLSHKKWKCNLCFMIYVSNFMLWLIEHVIMFHDLEKWDQFRCVVGETAEMKVNSVWFEQWLPYTEGRIRICQVKSMLSEHSCSIKKGTHGETQEQTGISAV